MAGSIALFVHTLGAPAFDGALNPAYETKMIGQVVNRTVPEDEPIYTLDWYAPALGYYADREWRLLSSSQEAAAIIGGVDIFHEANRVNLVPPFPAEGFFVVFPKSRRPLLSTRPVRPIQEEEDFVFAEVLAP